MQMHADNIPFLPNQPPPALHGMLAKAVMATPVLTVSPMETRDKLKQLLEVWSRRQFTSATLRNGYALCKLSSSPSLVPPWLTVFCRSCLQSNDHNAYPVVKVKESGKKALRGIILRDEIVRVCLQDYWRSMHVISDATVLCCTACDRSAHSYRSAHFVYGCLQILQDVPDKGDGNEPIALHTKTHHNPITVRETDKATNAYRIFRNLGLRHLIVVDSNFDVVGKCCAFAPERYFVLSFAPVDVPIQNQYMPLRLS
jgi:CBS domain-containing protein